VNEVRIERSDGIIRLEAGDLTDEQIDQSRV
jgi:hypothetical protein